jgi:predicted kinase
MTHRNGTEEPGGADEVGAAHDALHTGATIVVLSGPPGAGKTTTARALAESFERGVHLHTDDYWHAIVSGGIAPHLPESERQNHVVVSAIVATATAFALGGYTVVVDGVVGPWMLRHYRDAMSRHPALDVRYLVLRPTRRETLARAVARTAPDALTDEAAIAGLWEQFSDLGPLEDHAIDTTRQSATETLRTVQDAVRTGTHRLEPGAPVDSARG